MNIKIKRLAHGQNLPLPQRATEHSSCVDLYAAVDSELILQPGEAKLIPAGFAMEIPAGYEAQVRPRSGLALKFSIGILNSPGTIDSDYRGEVGVILFNFGKQPFPVKRGDRIAQMAIVRVENFILSEKDKLSVTERGSGGFGHSGI